MTFDPIIDGERLWAVRFDGMTDNVLNLLFKKWRDITWLQSFFKENINDLSVYFKITDVDKAIFDTIEDADKLACLILDISPDADLDKLFRPLDNNRTSEMTLGKEKARIRNRPKHASWLRIYAIKLCKGLYIITGGAIKLTKDMQDRDHTLNELKQMEKVRSFLLNKGIVDDDGFKDYLKDL